MRRVFSLSVLVILCGAAVISAAEVPKLKGPINDYAEVIPDEQEAKIRDFLLAQEKETSNQIVILTVKSLDGETIEVFAEKVFRTWKLGKADKDNGVLIVHSTDDRQMRIEVGHGLEGVLTDGLSGQIIRREMTPYFKKGAFGDGHMAAVVAIDQAIRGEYKAEADISTGGVVAIIVVIVIIVILFLIIRVDGDPLLLVILSCISNSSGGGRGGGGGYSGGGGMSGGGGASGRY